MKRVERLRWRIAELINRIPGQCWADIADWPLGHKRNPWSPQRPGCRADLGRLGACYCGKLRKPEALLPFHVDSEPCPTCYVAAGKTHELSCPKVTPEQFRAYLAAQREQMERQARRDAQMDRAERWIAGVVVVLVIALVWGWAR